MYLKSIFSSRIFCRVLSGWTTSFTCGVLCRELTTGNVQFGFFWNGCWFTKKVCVVENVSLFLFLLTSVVNRHNFGTIQMVERYWDCVVNQQTSHAKNIERHTADTIASWPNSKQCVIVHTSDLIMIIRQSIYIISIITREMGKLKTYSPTYCIMDNRDNMLNVTHTLDKMYLTDVL